MKKLLTIFLTLVMIAGLASAQTEDEDEGIGLSASLEFGIENINKGNDGDMRPYLAPIVTYEKSFMDDALDLYAELGYYFFFTKEPNQDGDEVFPQELYFDFSLTYNLFLNDASTLSFILENEIDTLIISPRYDDFNNIDILLIPGIGFNQTLDFGDIYARIGLPIKYVTYDKDEDVGLGLNITIGWQSNFGLEISLEERNSIKPEFGITIIPEFDYSFNSFTFYVNCEFDGIGGDGDVTVSPAIGVKYSF